MKRSSTSTYGQPPAKRARTMVRAGTAYLTRPRSVAAPRTALFNASRTRREEKKYHDTWNTALQPGYSGAVYLLNGVAQGTDYNQRLGREMVMRSLVLRGNVNIDIGTTTQDNFRCMVVYDRQCNGGQPAVTDILDDSVTTPQQTFAAMNLNNRDRFTVVLDRMYALSSSGANAVIQLDEYRKLNTEVQFSGTGNTDASIQTGALWLVVIGFVNGSGASTANIMTRVRFTDA